MRSECWDHEAAVTSDRATLDELASLRFVEAGHNALILGPVGVGTTFLATAPGHAAVRRRHPVHFERADQMFKRFRAARLDDSHDAEVRKLLRVDAASGLPKPSARGLHQRPELIGAIEEYLAARNDESHGAN